jgi:hypothetical protein
LTERCRTPRLMAECEALELQRRTAPQEAKNAVKRSGQEVPEGASKEKDNSQFINQIGFCGNHNFLAELPLDPEVRIGGDSGKPVALRKEQGGPPVELARNTVARTNEEAAKSGPTFEVSE